MKLKATAAGLMFLFLTVSSAFAQGNWGGGVDNDDLHFGFTFQYISSEFKITKTPDWRTPYPDPDNGGINLTTPLKSISSPISPGFALGFVSDLRLGNHVNVRLTPALVFADRHIDFEYDDPAENVRKIVQSATVDLPLGFKLKSDRRRNFRAYLLAGVKYSRDIISKKKMNDSDFGQLEKLVKLNRDVLWYEAGVGFDLYFEYFKLSPEVKLVNSVNNVLDRSQINAYNTPLEKLFIRNLQFSLYFE
jgi:hypothetical protein